MLYADASDNFCRADVLRMMHLNCSWVFNDCSWVSLRCRLTCKLHMPGARQACCHGNQVERCVSGLWGYPGCACTHPVEEESAVRRPGRGGKVWTLQAESASVTQLLFHFCLPLSCRLSASVPAHTPNLRKCSVSDHNLDLFWSLIYIFLIWLHFVKSQRAKA